MQCLPVVSSTIHSTAARRRSGTGVRALLQNGCGPSYRELGRAVAHVLADKDVGIPVSQLLFLDLTHRVAR